MSDTSASTEPPRLPTVVDEAGDSPRWLPWLGVGLFCLAAMLIAARIGMAGRTPEAPAEDGAQAAGAPGEDTPAKLDVPAQPPKPQ